MKKLLTTGLVLVLIAGVFAGCGKKEPITKETFVQITEQEGYVITEDDNPESEKTLTQTLAFQDNEEYMIVFIETKDLATAKEMLKSFTDEAEANKGSVSTKSSVNLANHGSFSLTSNGQFYRMVQIDNTLTWVLSSDEYKDEINNLFKLLGY